MALCGADFHCDYPGCGMHLSLTCAPYPGCFRDFRWQHLDGDYLQGRHLCPAHRNVTAADLDAQDNLMVTISAQSHLELLRVARECALLRRKVAHGCTDASCAECDQP